MKVTTTKLGYETVKTASSYVTPESLCIEEPKGSNQGYCIDTLFDYFYGGDSDKSEAYCAIFAWTIIDKACRSLGLKNKLPKTAGAKDLMNRAKSAGLDVDSVMAVGSVFYRTSTAIGASGHVGIVVGASETDLYCIEGNTQFEVAGKKYEGVWLMSYPLKSLGSRGFRFIHTERMYDNNLFEYDYDVTPGAMPGNTTNWIITLAVLGAIGGGAYYLFFRRKK